MKIGFLGSKIRIKLIREVIDNFFTDITPIYIEDELSYFNTEVEEKLKMIKSDVQGFVFAGELQHEFYNNIFFPDVPCDYIKKDWSSLENAFLAMSLKHIDFRCVSVDSYTHSSIRNLLHDLEIAPSENRIITIERSSFKQGYSESVTEGHRQAYENGEIKGCITAIYPVYNKLQNLNIPVVYARPTTEVIIKTINRIIEEHNLRKNQFGHIAILLVEIIPKKEYSYIRKNEYLYMHEKLKVAEEVYYFARNTHAAVVSESPDRFTILMNKKDLLEYTNGLQRFYLLNSIYVNTNCDVNIGIGYGFDPSEAKFNANLATEKFDSESKNITYIVPREGQCIGPLDFLLGEEINTKRIEEDYITKLSEQSGISQTMLYKLYGLIERYKKSHFTSMELAQKLEISQRNSSRLLRKLEDSNLAHIAGKQLTGESGRPSDIYEITLK